jgi:DNA (cytosine-5)-methyltransferase 1
MRVCDLFAGLGGFTCGALEAGANVFLAVDSDPAPLKLLGANAPRTSTVVATLGKEAVELPPAAPDLHVHMSTPCTTLSMARRGKTTVASNDGLHMIRWAVEFVLERGDHSWSLENAATRATRALFSELEAAHPERVAWAVFDSADFGAPQSRVRLIAGPKKLIRMLQGMPCSRRVSIRDAFAERGEVTPADYCKNQTRRSHGGDPTMRTVETQSFCVCASHALTWCHSDGKTVRVMTARDSSILMGFPSSWRLPKGSRVSQRAVGNAVCVALSKAITLAAIAVLNGDAAVITPPPMQQTTKKRTIAEVSRGEYDALRQRVDALEESLSPYASNTS